MVLIQFSQKNTVLLQFVFFLCRYEHGLFFPHLRESNFDYIGGSEDQPSCGKNFNIPLNKFGLGDEDYLSIFHQILMPVTHEFRPDLILVSAGYDSAIGKKNIYKKIEMFGMKNIFQKNRKNKSYLEF